MPDKKSYGEMPVLDPPGMSVLILQLLDSWSAEVVSSWDARLHTMWLTMFSCAGEVVTLLSHVFEELDQSRESGAPWEESEDPYLQRLTPLFDHLVRLDGLDADQLRRHGPGFCDSVEVLAHLIHTRSPDRLLQDGSVVEVIERARALPSQFERFHLQLQVFDKQDEFFIQSKIRTIEEAEDRKADVEQTDGSETIELAQGGSPAQPSAGPEEPTLHGSPAQPSPKNRTKRKKNAGSTGSDANANPEESGVPKLGAGTAQSQATPSPPSPKDEDGTNKPSRLTRIFRFGFAGRKPSQFRESESVEKVANSAYSLLQSRSAGTKLTDHFGDYAESNRRSAENYRTGTVSLVALALIAALVTYLWVPPQDVPALVWRLSLLVGTLGLAGYLARQSTLHRDLETWASAIMIQLRTFEHYIAPISDETTVDDIRRKFSEHVFLSKPIRQRGSKEQIDVQPLVNGAGDLLRGVRSS